MANNNEDWEMLDYADNVEDKFSDTGMKPIVIVTGPRGDVQRFQGCKVSFEQLKPKTYQYRFKIEMNGVTTFVNLPHKCEWTSTSETVKALGEEDVTIETLSFPDDKWSIQIYLFPSANFMTNLPDEIATERLRLYKHLND